jgi:hypothetical protein
VKRCSLCRAEQPLAAFDRKRASADGLQNVCRDCNRARARRYYADNRERHIRLIVARTTAARRRALEFIGDHLLAHPCVDCGERDLRVLDVDHRPGSGKSANVMPLARDGDTWSRIRAEIDKCDVRCRNCHARVTAQRRDRDWRTIRMRDERSGGDPE